MKTLSPSRPRISTYTLSPELLKTRAADLPELTSVTFEELFPDAPRPIPAKSPAEIRKVIRALTLQSLEKVDLSKIQPRDSVNILASSHGFTVYGGEAYVEMIRTIREEVKRRCGTDKIYLRAGVGLRFQENDEHIKHFGLDKDFTGKAEGITPVDRGVPIQTEIGTLYGVEKVYSARWLIHTHNNDIRELHYHRQIGRLFKPFAMSYATIETRSAYHQSMGPRAANLLGRMIYESPFVRDKFLCSVMLQVAPTGVIGVDASHDLVDQDRTFTRLNLAWYGKIVTLLGRLKETIVIIDYPGPLPYTTAGGLLFGNFINASVDEFDLRIPFPPYNRYSDMLVDPGGKLMKEKNLAPLNPAIRALIINYCSKGFPCVSFAQQLPTLAVGPQADFFRTCEQNSTFMDYALEAENLRKAVDIARRFARTENILVFDGAIAGFNVSEPLAEEMRRLAPDVSREVDQNLMPMWLRQRGIQ